MKISFSVAAGQTEKLDHVGIAEYFQRLRMSLSQHCRDFCRLGNAALEQSGFELTLQFARRPLFLDSQTQIKLTFLWMFALGQNEQVVGPG
ncbi:hypothetical protein D3C85_1390480 [compost metagenome]